MLAKGSGDSLAHRISVWAAEPFESGVATWDAGRSQATPQTGIARNKFSVRTDVRPTPGSDEERGGSGVAATSGEQRQRAHKHDRV
jgi:hypothetical protein